MDLNMRPGAVSALTQTPQVAHDVEAAAEAIVEGARDRAPKDSGAGARSIHSERVIAAVPTYRVSWDREHFYMGFHELGTEHEPARPFLRPAADEPSRRNK